MSPRSIALLFSPLGLLLISAARLLIISDYNTTTAVAIASSGGYFNTLLGTFIPLVPVFLPYIALLLLLVRYFVLSIITFIFAAFLTSTPLPLPVTLPLARADQHHIFALFSENPFIPFLLALIIVILVWRYHGSLIEAFGAIVIVAFAFALFAAASLGTLVPPGRLRLAGTEEDHIVSLVSGDLLMPILIALAFVTVLLSFQRGFSGAVATIVAVVATVALIPYVYNIYRVPRQPGYYTSVLHQPWLPAEKITLSTGHVYTGYVLSSAYGWFTVLLANRRTIRYVPLLMS
jgi:hypothetical protein